MSAVLKSTFRSADVPIDFREHIQNLRANDLLWEIDAPITIETEAHPLVRLQFRGLKEDQRRGFLLKNVRSADGRSFGTDLAIGCLAASRKIFETGLGMQPGDNLLELVAQALRNPLPPEVVTHAPCQEEVHMGASLTEHGGLGEFPIPISTPGYDNGPYTTFSHWVTKDPETGIYNIGNYRGQVKAPDRIGCFTYPPQHLGLHWVKCKRLGIPLEAALVIGVPPYVSYAANAKIPYESDELEIAGALSGRPLPVVQAKTVDLLVPAYAEIVIEGRISTVELEPEAPFGETHGFMSQPVNAYFMEVTAITHRKKPTWCSILSQFPPSESTRLRSISMEAAFFKHLKYDCNLAGVLDVHFPQQTSAYYTCFIKIKRNTKADPWQALHAAAGYDSFIKMFVVTDEDVDIRDPEMMLWATATRAMPHRDMRIIDGRMSAMDFSAIQADEAEGFKYMEPNGSSAILINACRPWAYPPVALPRKDFMENAIQRWQELGLPALELKKPWHGYDLGFWSEQCETEAQMAVEGRHYEIGEA
ncbi:UbiD family decarboxylase, partial [Immundisolibacter sp.]|uniref:UbiD family decarboxylase n=1 Tax=Immundisolibacter sp. TaxID=1934948 RepID=UPI00356587C4